MPLSKAIQNTGHREPAAPLAELMNSEGVPLKNAMTRFAADAGGIEAYRCGNVGGHRPAPGTSVTPNIHAG
jgi:hypothetical protein